MSAVVYNLFPRIRITAAGTWTDDDTESIIKTTIGNPSCESTGLYYSEDEGDSPQVKIRLDEPNIYSTNFWKFKLRVYVCPVDSYQATEFAFRVGSETFYETAWNTTGFAQWYEWEFETEQTYSAAEVKFAEVWITADDGSHKDLKIPTLYVEATEEYSLDQWDPDTALLAGGCSGFKVHKTFGGVVVSGTNQLENGIHFKSSGGVVVGKTTKYGKGGVVVSGSAYIRTGPQGNGGVKVGGTNQLEVKMRARGGVIVGSPSFPNGFFWRVGIQIPEADRNMLGVLIGIPVYVPFNMAQYRVEDSEGNILAHEIVSTNGLRMSVFFKTNINTEEQTVYLYGKGRAE